MKLLSWLFFSLKQSFGIYKLSKYGLQNKQIYSVLMYHGVENDSCKAAFRLIDLPEKAIRQEIEFYIRQGYELRTHIDSPNPGLILTFDDGNRNIAELVVEISEQYNVQPIIAICPGVIERQQPFWFEEIYARLLLTESFKTYPICVDCQTVEAAMGCIMQHYFSDHSIQSEKLLEEIRLTTSDVNSEELAQHPAIHANLDWHELEKLVSENHCLIAAHTLFHDSVTHMTPDQFANDLEQCKSMIKDNLGVDCEHFIYPFGDHGECCGTNILSGYGYKYSYIVDEKINSGTGDFQGISRITGQDMNKALGYYQYLWNQRHLQLESHY